MGIGFGILAGAAGAFPAIQRGIDDYKAREQADEDRAYLREQREAAKADRAFGLTQRDRQVKEQARQDTLRDELAAVPQTREIDTRPQAVREITHDDTTGPEESTPSATQLPATKTVAAPDWQKLKSTAEAYRKGRDFEKADAYDQLANRAQFADSARRFQTVAAGAGTMSLEQLAKAATEVYNSDPLPAQIEGVTPVAGGLQFTFSNKDTGQSQTLTVKSKEELLQKLEAYYSPDTYAAAVKAQRDAKLKVEEEIGKNPVVSVPKGYVDRRSGKFNRTDFGSGVQIGEDAEGNPIYASGGGRGAAKPVDPMKDIDEAVDFIAKSSAWKEQGAAPADVSRFRRLARQFYEESIDPATGRPGLDASRAAEAAATAVTQPEKLQINFDPKSGQIVRTLPLDGGSIFTVEKLGRPGSTSLKKEELEQLARDQLASAPVERRDLYLRASRSPDDLRSTLSDIEKAQRSPAGIQALAQALRRQPTEEEIKTAVKMTQDRVKSYSDLFSNHLPKKLLAKPEEKKKSAAGLGLDWTVEPGLGNTAAEMLNNGL